jgi:hypothetical protein
LTSCNIGMTLVAVEHVLTLEVGYAVKPPAHSAEW